MVTQGQEHFSLSERLKCFSTWHKAKRAVAVCLHLQKSYKATGSDGQGQLKSGDSHTDVAKEKAKTQALKSTEPRAACYVPVNTQDLLKAKIEIIRSLQREEFQNEISLVHRISAQVLQDQTQLRTMKKASSLYKMDPFLDKDGILRVGGRLKHADLSEAAKHIIVLPKKGHVTSLVIAHYHSLVEHQGRSMTHSKLRSSGFWIIGGASIISDFIAKCTSCRRLGGPLQEQKMADMPKDWVQPAPPFSYRAVDYFGPWYKKEGCRQVKRYGVLLTCLASRAVHLEVANSLTADSFINAYCHFVGRRSDQGTNFVGARNELHQSISEQDNNKIRQELLKRNCNWAVYKMNVPHASHMGGIWERQIRMVHNILTALLSRVLNRFLSRR